MPSPYAKMVPTFDLKPEMSAYEVTEAVLPGINKDKYDVIILNFANCDMVGHTGVMASGGQGGEDGGRVRRPAWWTPSWPRAARPSSPPTTATPIR